MPSLSIIIPVYNVEKYLKECVKSVLMQSIKDFEILLIDDGSKDSSGKLCDEIASTDSRIRVYHKPNGGLSSARNYGIDRALGEYIIFLTRVRDKDCVKNRVKRAKIVRFTLC